MLDTANQGTGSRRRQAMGDEDRPRGSDHVDGRSAQAVPDEQRGAAQSRRHRVAVAREGHAGVVGDDPLDLGGGRERGGREGEQRLGVGQFTDRGPFTVRSAALALVTGRGAEDVEGALGLLGVRR